MTRTKTISRRALLALPIAAVPGGATTARRPARAEFGPVFREVGRLLDRRMARDLAPDGPLAAALRRMAATPPRPGPGAAR